MSPRNLEQYSKILNEGSTSNYEDSCSEKKNIKNQEIRKPILNILDTLLSVLIVSPCVIGFWRGTWQLMAIYIKFFPVWESFIFGSSMHVAFAVTQHVFDEAFTKKSSNLTRKLLNSSFMKCYTYTFALICVMTWNSGWFILDELLGVKLSEKEVVQAKGSGPLLLVFACSVLLLLGLKCVNCCIAPPFVICLDKRARMFEIPTRFKTKKSTRTSLHCHELNYCRLPTCIVSNNLIGSRYKNLLLEKLLSNSYFNKHELTTVIIMSGKATDFGLYKEKQGKNSHKPVKIIVIVFSALVFLIGILLTIIILTRNVYLTEKPLEINIERPMTEKLMASESKQTNFYPQPFGLTYRGNPPAVFTPTTTQQVTTFNYPQLQSYRQPNYPKNIQDVIGFMSKRGQKAESNTINYHVTSNDPFYLYKPQDPSDINLLATGSFRFAPPVWGGIKTVPKIYHPQHQQENSDREVITPIAKPLVITLNIYPTESDLRNIYNYVQRPLPYKVENPEMTRVKVKKNGMKHNSMVIHLNVFPEPGALMPKERVFRETEPKKISKI